MGILGRLLRWPSPAVAVGTYTTWVWPVVRGGYAEMHWELEPRTDPSPVGYFWSHQVALLGGEAAYVGLQTQGSEPTGKIAVFSIWNAIDADGTEYAAPFSGEGSGMSVRIRYPWEAGHRERLSLRSEDGGWWRAQVGDVDVGRIRVDATWGLLAPTSIMWTERYAPPLRTCADMGHAVAWFGTPAADGGAVPSSHHNHLATVRGCQGSSVRDDDGGVVHVMGAPASAAVVGQPAS